MHSAHCWSGSPYAGPAPRRCSPCPSTAALQSGSKIRSRHATTIVGHRGDRRGDVVQVLLAAANEVQEAMQRLAQNAAPHCPTSSINASRHAAAVYVPPSADVLRVFAVKSQCRFLQDKAFDAGICVVARCGGLHHRGIRPHHRRLPHEAGRGPAAIGVERRVLRLQIYRARIAHGTAVEALVLDEYPQLALGIVRSGDRSKHLVE